VSDRERLAAAVADRYTIERELGRGGMATVYLAHDIRHGRKVALKVLKPELAAILGADRFVVEIRTTASLQHPHILPLFDSGEADGFLYYVMPFIDGETLRTRLDRETQFGVDEAVGIAVSIASALQYAHSHGVIHRDIKPENILLHEGRPVVADFGIALAVSAAAGGRMTETGLSLGTPHYMSPEQATADREITGRSDIFSLGSVLYEMLSGDPPHTGASAQQIIMKIITEHPKPVTEFRKAVPPNVAAAVARSLEKLPADRFESAKAFADALTNRSFTTAGDAAVVPGRADGRNWRRIAAGLAFAVLVMSGIATSAWVRDVPGGGGIVRRFYVTMSHTLPDFGNAISSPDGSRLIYTNVEGSLMIRDADALESRPIPGSEQAWATVFSPDGRSLAINTGFPGAVKVLALDGGSVRTLIADSTHGTGLAWSPDGWIYFLHGPDYGRDLMRVRAAGGTPEFVARPDSAAGALFFRLPRALPDGRRLLLTVQPRQGETTVGVLEVSSGQVTILGTGVQGRYSPTGHLLVVRGDGSLQAAKFDARRGELRGPFVTVADGLAIVNAFGEPVSLSDDGTLVYQLAPRSGSIVRVTREGRETLVDDSWQGDFITLAVSPDGERLAIGVLRGGRSDLWLRDLATGVMTRLSSGGSQNYRPSWTPDSRELLFTSDQQGRITSFRVPADGSSPATPVALGTRSVDEALLSRDGRWLIVRAGSGGGRDIHAMRVGDDSVLQPVVATAAQEFSPTLSPDGQWLAYGSDESGQTEVYVRPFPNTAAARFTVSRNGGTEPLWSPTGRELFYRDGQNNLVAVELVPGDAFRIASSRVLFSTRAYASDNRHRSYTVAPDGSFYFIRAPSLLMGSSYVVVVLNWFEELKRKVPR
jgi:eukaryotic-like serine/threonine-protein kinase